MSNSINQSLVRPSPIPGLPSTVVVIPSEKIRKIFSKSVSTEQTKKELLLADSLPLSVFENFSLLSPFIGAPALGVALEILVASAVTRVFFLGACGGLVPNEQNIGDFFLPSGAISEDGTSKLYGARVSESDWQSQLQDSLLSQLTLDSKTESPQIPIHRGIVWSTDAPFLETREKLSHFSGLGATAVEMEFAALLRLSHVFQLQMASCLLISDILSDSWEKGFSAKKLTRSAAIAVKSLNSLM